MNRTELALLLGGLALGAALHDITHPAPAPCALTDTLMAIVVWSDGTMKAGPIKAADCASLAEYAHDGKVFRLAEGDDEDKPYAMAFTCAPEALLKSTFGKRQTR